MDDENEERYGDSMLMLPVIAYMRMWEERNRITARERRVPGLQISPRRDLLITSAFELTCSFLYTFLM
jgi:hypothetical protein